VRLPVAVDPADLEQTGWGVVFSEGADPRIEVALQPLLELRRRQAGVLYKKMVVGQGESARDFLWNRQGAGAGLVDPDRMPYYLLLVGDPATIPFEFQYQLNISVATGRISFDRIDEYSVYAKSLVEAETNGVTLPQRVVLAAVRHPGDRATEHLSERLVDPLTKRLALHSSGWTVERASGELSREQLSRFLGGEETPSLFFLGAHGLRFRAGDEDQRRRQGALVCSDWPGRGVRIERGSYFSEEDLGQDAQLHGLVAFLHSSYSAGTPLLDDFPHRAAVSTERRTSALNPFINRLVQRMLSHPNGGALAVVGRVERTWLLEQPGGERTDHNLETFEDIFRYLLTGARIGHALRPLAERYVELTVHLSDTLEQMQSGEETPEELLAFLWTAKTEARNTILLGDPAVRLLGGRSVS